MELKKYLGLFWKVVVHNTQIYNFIKSYNTRFFFKNKAETFIDFHCYIKTGE